MKSIKTMIIGLMCLCLTGGVFLGVLGCGGEEDEGEFGSNTKAYSLCLDGCQSNYNGCWAVCNRYCSACGGNLKQCINKCDHKYK